jgi:hypothetical protein
VQLFGWLLRLVLRGVLAVSYKYTAADEQNANANADTKNEHEGVILLVLGFWI